MRNKLKVTAVVALSTVIALYTNAAIANINRPMNIEEKISFTRNGNQASEKYTAKPKDQELKKGINRSTVKIVSSVDGSGVIVKNGKGIYEILTAWHVLKNATKNEKVKITTFDGTQHRGIFESINRIGASDMATINFISDAKYKTADLLETEFKREMQVVVAGYPNGSDSIYFDDGKITFSSVEAIADGHPWQYMDQGYQLVYTSKTMFGVSGGGIYTTQGELIGIHGRGELDKQVTTRENKIIKSGVNYGMPLNIYLDPIHNATTARLRKVIPSAKDYPLEAVHMLPIHRGNERMMIAIMDEIISRENYFPAYLFKAKALIQIGDQQGAIHVLSQGLAINNLSVREKVLGYSYRAGSHGSLANFEEVKNDHKQVIRFAADPSYKPYLEQTIGDTIVSSKLAIINALKKMQRRTEAQKHFKELEEYRNNNELKPWAKYQIDEALAFDKFFEGKIEESLELFLRALSHIESEDLQIKDFMNADERASLQSKEYMKKTLNYDLFKEQEKSTMLFIAKFIYTQIGMLNESMNIVNGYIKNDPFDLKALGIRASLFHLNGEYTKAEKDVKKILDIEPRNHDALYKLSDIYRDRDKDMKNSCQYYARYVLEQGGAGFHKDGEHHKECQRLGFID